MAGDLRGKLVERGTVVGKRRGEVIKLKFLHGIVGTVRPKT
jgi:hypothetical protein